MTQALLDRQVSSAAVHCGWAWLVVFLHFYDLAAFGEAARRAVCCGRVSGLGTSTAPCTFRF